MEIKIGTLTLSGQDEDGDDLNTEHVCLHIGLERESVNIDALIMALRTMALR